LPGLKAKECGLHKLKCSFQPDFRTFKTKKAPISYLHLISQRGLNN